MKDKEKTLKTHPSFEELVFESKNNKLVKEGLDMLDLSDWINRFNGKVEGASDAQRRGDDLVQEATWKRQIRIYKKVFHDVSLIEINNS